MKVTQEYIMNLFNNTLVKIFSSSGEWEKFLQSACKNYKLSFYNQVLLYAQKPDATAILTMRNWNKKFGRFVNRGTKGIALLNLCDKSNAKINWFFDVSSTSETSYAKPVPIWTVTENDHKYLVDEISMKYDLSKVSNLEDAFYDMASELVNSEDDILENENTQQIVNDLLTESLQVAFLTRCKIYDKILTRRNLDFLSNEKQGNLQLAFISKYTKLARIGLSHIAQTVNKLRSQKGISERSESNENNLQERGGLLSSKFNVTAAAEIDSRTIQYSETGLFNESGRDRLYTVGNVVSIDSAPERSAVEGQGDGGTSSVRDEREGRRERATQEGQLVGVRSETGEHHSQGAGDSDERSSEIFGESEADASPLISQDEQIKEISELAEEEKNTSAFSISDEDIQTELQTYGSGFVNGKFRIYKQLTESFSTKENIAFLKKEYGIGGHSPYNGISQDHDAKGMVLYIGYGESRVEKNLTWNEVEKRIRLLIQQDRYLNETEMQEYDNWIKAETAKSLSETESVTVEQNPMIVYKVGDFYEFRGNDAETVADILNLNVTHRGDQQIVGFPDFQYKTNIDKIQSAGYEVAGDLPEVKNYTYQYDVGDIIFIGATKFEIVSVNNDTVDISDTDMPLFIKNFTKEEFEKQLDSHYGNKSLRVEKSLQQNVESEIPTITCEWSESNAFEDGKTYSVYEFDKIMKEADEERVAGKKAAIEKYGSAEAWYNSDTDDEFSKFYGYDKTKFTINLPDGSKITERQDIGDGFGGVIDFLNRYPHYKNVVEQLIKVRDLQKVQAENTTEIQVNQEEHNSHDAESTEHEKVNFDLSQHEIEIVGKKERFRRNIEAINILKECEFDNRLATPDEQIKLSKYVGWGGLQEAFDENSSAWADEFLELYTVLSPEEYKSAKESTLTSFFTPPVVIKSIYSALENLGFQIGNILEPSCGVGNFIGMLPDSMSGSKIYGVELDKVSAGIARQLYQNTSISNEPFEKTKLYDNFFDAAVGNVPFGDFKINDVKYNKYNFLIHDYFFAKTLDKLRSGGVLAFVTAKGTMDKKSIGFRKYMAQRAELLGAIRLPDNTFSGNAGTDVTTDILFFQKRERIVEADEDWIHLSVDENGIAMNSYFVKHPEMILGDMVVESGRFGEVANCKLRDGDSLDNLLSEAIKNINGKIEEVSIEDYVADTTEEVITADPTVRNYSFTVVDNEVYFRENSIMTHQTVSDKTKARIVGLINLRDTARELIDMQVEDYPEDDFVRQRVKLNNVYDEFVSKNGRIASRGNKQAFSDDSSYSFLLSLEIYDDDGNFERKSDIFTKRTVMPHKPVEKVETSTEALVVSIGEKAQIDIEYMSELSGKSEKELVSDLKGVIFLNPRYKGREHTEKKYLMSDEYLSGNVREKLAEAKAIAASNPEFEINVNALEKVQPVDLKPGEISVRLGVNWIPTEHIDDFMYELLKTPSYYQGYIKARYSEELNEWSVRNKSYGYNNLNANQIFGTKRINAYEIIERLLNQREIVIKDKVTDELGKERFVVNVKQTQLAQSKADIISQRFKEWVFATPERREFLCSIYNTRFNSIRPREYDGSNIVFHNINPELTLKKHQKDAIAHHLYGGNTLFAHSVGAGKTFEMIAAAQESKYLGLCNKSMFVVPKHLTEQCGAEYMRLYPTANVLVAKDKDFTKQNRKEFCSRIATGDYDAVIVGYTQFEKTPLSYEWQQKFLEREKAKIESALYDAKNNSDMRYTTKKLESTLKKLTQKVEAAVSNLYETDEKDDVISFEQLGIDRLFVDEAHYFKNLATNTKMSNVRGIQTTGAEKSFDLYMKIQYLNEITDYKGVVFATGTPISNSMVEMYTIQKYLQPQVLKSEGLTEFDNWAANFGETVLSNELSPEGKGYREVRRFGKFFNLPELINMYKMVADVKTADMLDLKVPDVEYVNVAVKPSEIQKKMIGLLSERAERIHKGTVNAYEDNMLNITNEGRAIALDQRLMNPNLPDFEGSKVNECIKNVYQIWEETSKDRLTQLIFCDLATPGKKDKFSVYDDIRDKLVLRGVPENEIAFIHSAKTETQKDTMFKKVRHGDIRILLGSTPKMGTGANVQDKLVALHNLDVPWKPSDLEQRAGRIIRQGNTNENVKIFRYVTEETFDAYSYQLIESKQRFISQVMTSKSPARVAADIDEQALSYAEVKALATGDPRIKEKMDLDTDVQKLRVLKSSYLNEKYNLEDAIAKSLPQEINHLETIAKGAALDMEVAKQNPKQDEDGNFVGMFIQGTKYTDKEKAGEILLEFTKRYIDSPIYIGEYRGFKLSIDCDGLKRDFILRLKNELSYTAYLGVDNITRLDNAIDKIEERFEKLIVKLQT